VRRRELLQFTKRRIGARHVLVSQVTVDRLYVDGAIDLGGFQHRRDFRAEPEVAALLSVDERLLPDPITREQETPLLRVPKGESEHAVQMLDTGVAVVLVQVDDDLCVALRCETMTPLQERVSELLIVVDLAVQDDDDRSILVEDRLITRLEVDHAQTLDSEPEPVFEMDASRIG